METETRSVGFAGLSGVKKAALVLGVGGLLLLIGPLFPFLTDDFGNSLGGLDTDDGKLFLGFGVALVLLAGGVWALKSKGARRGVAGLAALAALFMLFAAIVDVADDYPSGVSVGFGLYIALIGAIAASVGGVWALFAKEPEGEPPPPPPPPPPAT